MLRFITSITTLVASAVLTYPCLAAAPKGQMAQPDFTEGDPIPEKANHDWALGATGAR